MSKYRRLVSINWFVILALLVSCAPPPIVPAGESYDATGVATPTVPAGGSNDATAVADYHAQEAPKIVYQVATGVQTSHIYVVDANGQNVHALSGSDDYDAHPDVSVDGSEIVFVNRSGGNQQLYRMKMDGSSRTPIPNTVNAGSPVWGRDSISFLIFSHPDGVPNRSIYRINVDGTDRVQLVSAGSGVIGDVVDVLEGDYYLIFSKQDADQGNSDLYLKSIWDDDPPIQLTRTPNENEHSPAVSPDGRTLAYVVGEQIVVAHFNGTSDLSVVNRIAVSMPPTGAIGTLDFSDNGRTLFFDAGAPSDLFSVTIDGSQQQQLTDNNNWDMSPSVVRSHYYIENYTQFVDQLVNDIGEFERADPAWGGLSEFFGEAYRSGVEGLSKSPYIRGCLEGDLYTFEAATEATLALPWNAIQSAEDLQRLLMSPALQSLYDVLGIAIQECGNGDALSFMARYSLDRRNFPTGFGLIEPFGNETPPTLGEYLECINYRAEYLRQLDPQCSAIASLGDGDGPAVSYPERTDIQMDEVVIRSDRSSIQMDEVIIRSDRSSTSSSSSGANGEPRIRDLSITVSQSSASAPSTSSSTSLLPKEYDFSFHFGRNWQLYGASVAVFIGAAFFPVKYAIYFLAQAPLVAPILIDLFYLGPRAFTQEQEERQRREREEERIRRLEERILRLELRGIRFPQTPQTCPGPIDARLPDGHPLLGMSFQYGDEPVTPAVIPLSCQCILREEVLLPSPSTEPFADWVCKTDAERRFDCIENPYGPDDAPRPECMRLLAEDNEVQVPIECGIMHCMDGMTITEGCACKTQTGTLPNPICPKIFCPKDTQINEKCECVTFDGDVIQDLCNLNPESCLGIGPGTDPWPFGE